MERMIATGKAPNYTEIAAELGVLPRKDRRRSASSFRASAFPGWFYPNTDTIMSFPPFNDCADQPSPND